MVALDRLSGAFETEITHEVAHHGDDKRPQIFAAGIICLVIAYVACLLRLCSRRVARISLAYDDLAILVALLFFSVFVGLVLATVKHGLGRHLIFVVSDIETFAKVRQKATRILEEPTPSSII